MHKIFGYECRRLLLNKFFFGHFTDHPVLRLAGAVGKNSFGNLPHRALFRMELRRLSQPDASPFMDRCAVFPDFLYILPGAAHSRAHRSAAPAPPLQYALIRCAAAFLGVFLLVLACLAEAAVFYGYCFGWYGWSGLLLPALITLAPPLIFALEAAGFSVARSPSDLCLDARPVSVRRSPAAGSGGNDKRQLFHGVSAYSGSDRPGIFPSAVRSRLSADSSGCRHRLSALSGAAGERKNALSGTLHF